MSRPPRPDDSDGPSKASLPGQLAVTRALREFVGTEVVGGAVLLAATAVALIWANSPWQAGYQQLWHTEVAVALGRWQLELDLREWVNEGLMAVFFVVVGLEVKREFLLGELRDRRQAALPVLAALGGMVVPALVYVAFNAGGAGSGGWGIPMATDIAFALGVLAVVAPGLPGSLRLFLLTLAIVDDIGAIVVIAVFYSSGVDFAFLGMAGAVLALAYGLRQRGLVYAPLFVVLGIAAWLALHGAGVHATLAGVAMGLLAPARPALDREITLTQTEQMLDVYSPAASQATAQIARLSVSRLEWLEHGLHPWSSLLVVPIFALANAGVAVNADLVRDSVTSPVTLGVLFGLLLGKTVGITGSAWLACRLGLARLPAGVRWRQVAGVAALGGIGFTVSLFITNLAFDDAALANGAKIGILVASAAATAVGALLLRGGGGAEAEDGSGEALPHSPS